MQLQVHTVRYVNRSDLYRRLGISEDVVVDQISYGDADATLVDTREFAALLEVWVEEDGISREDILEVLPDAEGVMVNLEA